MEEQIYRLDTSAINPANKEDHFIGFFYQSGELK